MTHSATSKTRRRQLPENVQRGEWADRAILAFQIVTGTDRDDAIADLLANVMHLCDTEKSSFNDQLTTARCHYEAELRGE